METGGRGRSSDFWSSDGWWSRFRLIAEALHEAAKNPLEVQGQRSVHAVGVPPNRLILRYGASALPAGGFAAAAIEIHHPHLGYAHTQIRLVLIVAIVVPRRGAENLNGQPPAVDLGPFRAGPECG